MVTERVEPVEEAAEDEQRSWKKSWVRDYFEAICIAVVFALFVRTYVVQAFKIPSSSMEQNLLVGDHILVDKFAQGSHPAWMESFLPYRTVQRRDVIVFKYPRDARRDFIKRVIGAGGDRIVVHGDVVYRNGEALDEPYIYLDPLRRSPRPTYFGRETKLARGVYMVMGDNRRNSEDSRFWNTVDNSYIKGKALLIYWSFEVPEKLKYVEVSEDATPIERGESLGYTAWHFFTKTRWRRTFRRIR